MNTIAYSSPDEIKVVAVIGTGAVGASWIALLLAHGMEVIAHDPGPNAEGRVRAFIESAWPALRQLGIATTEDVPLGGLRFVAQAGEAAEAAEMIMENVPEKPAVKASVLAEIDRAAAAHKIIASSTGGIPPSRLQDACNYPERLVVMHPFHPAHLIPLVEVVGGKKTSPAVLEWSMNFCRMLGKHPILLRREATGHMVNRLQFALLREAVHCLVEDVASAEDIDAAVRYGLGPRWALMGSLLTLHLAGGGGGMAGILDHAGDAIETWWGDLGRPELTGAVRAKLVAAADEISRGRSIEEWAQWRDEKLTQVLSLLREEPRYEAADASHHESR